MLARAMGAAVLAATLLVAAPARAGSKEDQEGLAAAAALVGKEAGAHRLILLGEMHGTREAPQLAAALATAYSAEGPVVIGLEMHSTMGPVLEAYLASDGGADARAALLAAPFWQVPREQNDGRRNLETVRLVEYLRALKAQKGRDLRLFVFDLEPGVTVAERDQWMANRVRAEYAKLPAKGRLLTLSGNVHAMHRSPFEGFQKPMGDFLADLEPYSVNITALGGEFWACMDGVCGPKPHNPAARESGVDRSGVFDLQVVLPKFTIARLLPEKE